MLPTQTSQNVGQSSNIITPTIISISISIFFTFTSTIIIFIKPRSSSSSLPSKFTHFENSHFEIAATNSDNNNSNSITTNHQQLQSFLFPNRLHFVLSPLPQGNTHKIKKKIKTDLKKKIYNKINKTILNKIKLNRRCNLSCEQKNTMHM